MESFGQTDRRLVRTFGQTDRHLVRVFGQTDRHSYGYIAKSTYYKNFFVYALIITKILLLALLCPKEFKYVLRYEIGPLEVGQKNERTYIHTDIQRMPNYNIDTLNLTYLFLWH